MRTKYEHASPASTLLRGSSSLGFRLRLSDRQERERRPQATKHHGQHREEIEPKKKAVAERCSRP